MFTQPVSAGNQALPGGRLRIAFVINSIGSGGAERVLEIVLRFGETRALRHEVHLITLDDDPVLRPMPDRVTLHRLDARRLLGRSVAQLRRCLDAVAPDVVVSLLVRANMATAIASIARPWKMIVCERMHLSSHLAGRYSGFGYWWRARLPLLLYRRADRVLAVSPGVADDLIALGVPSGRVTVLPNPYELDAITEASASSPEIELPERFHVAVGRLVKAKGFDDLIEAYRRARAAPHLVILGEGPELGALTAQVARAGLAGKVRFVGYLANPFAVVGRAEAYVSASHNEGFPNALAEAMVLGRACLVTDCPSGPAHLIGAVSGPLGVTQGPNGLIAQDGDVEALAEGLRRLEAPALRQLLGARAGEAVKTYRAETVAERYWQLIEEIAAVIR